MVVTKVPGGPEPLTENLLKNNQENREKNEVCI